MAKSNSNLYAALEKAQKAKKRLDKNGPLLSKREEEVERLKADIIKDQLIVDTVGANEMFAEFGLEGTEIRLGALLYAVDYIKTFEDENKALDEFYVRGKEYLNSIANKPLQQDE